MPFAQAQTLPLPYEIVNASEFSDSEIYVGLVGKIDGTDVWMNMATGAINEMKLSDNTLQGPIYNGNRGPGGDGKYADVFTKLSDIPNKTLQIPHIYAVRIFFAFKSPLYLYFFGDGGGYSAPSLSNSSDPNLGLRYELVELTYGDNGLWTNTTRVDAYQYPMGLEVWGSDGFYKRVGEVLTHEQILTQWQTQVSDAFQSSFDEELGIIVNPSKASDFQTGGAQNDYFADYVQAVWNRYENEDLLLSIGEAGIWKGRVSNDQFIFTNQSNGTVGMISAQPSTLEILEASGVLAEDVASTPDVDADKNIQKHFSAAFNRGAIDINAPAGELVEWSDASEYFNNDTYNEYVAFWHSQDISFEGETYAFAYDDVFDYSSTIQSTVPTQVKITLGGFADDPYIAPTSVSISASELALNSGESAQLSAVILPLDADNQAVVWQSSNTAVATVNDGLIYAVSAGSTTITARSGDGSVSTTCAVNVDGGTYSNDSTLRIEAEDYSSMSGVQTQSTSDTDGGLNVGWIDTGDTMTYDVNLDTSGNYTLAYRIASISNSGGVQFLVDGVSVATTQFATTGDWQSWSTVTTSVTLSAGNHSISLVATGASWNINWFELTLNDATTDNGQTSDASVIIEAEDYSDMSGIDTQLTADPESNTDDDLNVGWIDAGDYLDYTVVIDTAGSYTLNYRVASLPGDAEVEFIVDGETLATTNIASTGGWQTWTTVTTTVTLDAGSHSLRLLSTAANWNINWFSLTLLNQINDNSGENIDTASQNLALNATASASSEEHSGTIAAYAIDGDTSSRWSSAHSDNQWLQVDLGQNADITRIHILWETAMAQDYDILASDDGSNWTSIASITDNTLAENNFTDLTVNARFIRINGLTRTTIWGFSIYELAIYGE